MKPAVVLPLVVLCLGLGWRSANAQLDAPNGGGGEKSVDAWIAQLQHDDWNQRWRAAYALGRKGPAAAAAVPHLTALLKDRHLEVRWYAIDALGRIGPAATEAIDAITASFADRNNDSTYRQNAARALGAMGPAAEAALPLLAEVRSSSDPALRAAAALAEWRIAARLEAISTLAAMTRSPHPETAWQGISALLETGPKLALATDDLAAALSHADPDVRRAAVAGLAEVGLPAVGAILRAAATPQINRRNVADALGAIAERVRQEVFYDPATTRETFLQTAGFWHQQVIPLLAEILRSDDEAQRRSAARALAQLGPLAAPALLIALRTGSAPAREAAAEAIDRVEATLPGDEESLDNVELLKRQMLGVLTDGLGDPNDEVRRAALQLFAALKFGPEGGEAAPRLREILSNEQDERIRRQAARALERLEAHP